MRKNTNFYQSLKFALAGFVCAVRRERNLRFHISAAFGVTLFGVFYGLERMEWVALTIVFAVVICAELVNTAVENAVDTATDKFHPNAKAAKDTAAAAVLAAAVMSLVVGACIFSDAARIIYTVKAIVQSPARITLFAVAAVLAGLFLRFGGEKADKTDDNR